MLGYDVEIFEANGEKTISTSYPNIYILLTDRYFLIDYPIAYEQQMIIKKYRQDLRDFINNNEIKILAGEKVDWPDQPDFIDLNIIY